MNNSFGILTQCWLQAHAPGVSITHCTPAVCLSIFPVPEPKSRRKSCRMHVIVTKAAHRGPFSVIGHVAGHIKSISHWMCINLVWNLLLYYLECLQNNVIVVIFCIQYNNALETADLMVGSFYHMTHMSCHAYRSMYYGSMSVHMSVCIMYCTVYALKWLNPSSGNQCQIVASCFLILKMVQVCLGDPSLGG